jgi:predicted Na+-dependent transporter
MNHSPGVTPASTLNPWQALWKAFRFRPWVYLLVLLIRIVISALLPLAAAWLIRTFFNALTGQAAAGLNLWTILALLAVIYLSDVVRVRDN